MIASITVVVVATHALIASITVVVVATHALIASITVVVVATHALIASIPQELTRTPPGSHSRSPTTAKFYSTPNARRVASPPRPSGDLLPGAEVVQAVAGK